MLLRELRRKIIRETDHALVFNSLNTKGGVWGFSHNKTSAIILVFFFYITHFFHVVMCADDGTHKIGSIYKSLETAKQKVFLMEFI